MSDTNILIVEDEGIIAEDLKNRLRKLGYAIPAVASSGEEAVQKSDETRPDLVLMDIRLKGEMSGVEAADRIRNRFNIPVIYLTAYADENTLHQAKITEPFGYVLKPFDERELHIAIEMARYKHRMEQALHASEDRLAGVIDVAPDAIISIDGTQRIRLFNQGAEETFGYTAKEVLGRPLDLLLPPHLTEVHRRHVTEFGRSPDTARRMYKRRDISGRRKNRTLFPAEASISKIESSGATFFTVILRDISERKKAEEEIIQSHKQMHSLSAHLESIREEERTRLAREIHDELGQALTALRMDVSYLDRKLATGVVLEEQRSSFKIRRGRLERRNAVPKSRKEALQEKLQSMMSLINATIRAVRRISTELRPGVLDDLGLTAAIEWQAQEFQARTGIRCRLALIPEDIPLDRACSTAVFRILQEALINVARHAKATRVDIGLKQTGNHLLLEIRDNGKGITLRKITDRRSFGLLGMRERAFLFGGEVRISGARGRGTTVTVRIPLG